MLNEAGIEAETVEDMVNEDGAIDPSLEEILSQVRGEGRRQETAARETTSRLELQSKVKDILSVMRAACTGEALTLGELALVCSAF